MADRRRSTGAGWISRVGCGTALPLLGLVAVLAALRDRYWVTAAGAFSLVVFGIVVVHQVTWESRRTGRR